MNGDAHRKYQTAKSRVEDASDGLLEMRKGSVSSRRLVRYWREFLYNCVTCQECMQKAAQAAGFQKFKQDLWNACRSAPEIYYLFQSRNSETHSFEAVSGKPAQLRISDGLGEIAFLEADNVEDIFFYENYIVEEKGSERKLPDVFGVMKDGKFIGEVKGNGYISVSKPYLELLPACVRGQVYPVPAVNLPPDQRFLYFAQQYVEFLRKWEADLRSNLGLPN